MSTRSLATTSIHYYTPAPAQDGLTIRTAADLEIGDTLTLPDRDLVITGLIPATRKEALAYGSREVRSGAWWQTYDADEPVTASPGRTRLERAGLPPVSVRGGPDIGHDGEAEYAAEKAEVGR